MMPLIFRAEKAQEIRQNTEQFREAVRQAQEQAAEETKEENEIPVPYKELLTAIREYNQWLYDVRQTGLTGPQAYQISPIKLIDFGLPDETFGIIYIPKMSVEMPLYLGASEVNMANGAAVLAQTSIPIGGDNTNAVIAGHRGYDGYRRYFPVKATGTSWTPRPVSQEWLIYTVDNLPSDGWKELIQ